MNVAELIAKLEKMPQNLDVVFEHPEFGSYGIINCVHIVDMSDHCDGDDCDICQKCELYKIKKDLAVELEW